MTERRDTDNLLTILAAVQEHIRLQDTKASGLLTVIGIVFSFSMFSIDTFLSISSSLRIAIYICGAFYLSFFLVSIVMLVIALFPMRKKNSGQHRFPRYAIDVYRMTKSSQFENDISRNIESSDVLDQIKICSKIAFIKEKLVRSSAITIIASVVMLLSIIVLIVIQ